MRKLAPQVHNGWKAKLDEPDVDDSKEYLDTFLADFLERGSDMREPPA